MKRLLAPMALTCVLSVSALAGDIPTLGAPQPAPAQTTTTTSPGDVPTVGTAEQVSDAALSALLTVLGFLAV
jgi:hypothetical protein